MVVVSVTDYHRNIQRNRLTDKNFAGIFKNFLIYKKVIASDERNTLLQKYLRY